MRDRGFPGECVRNQSVIVVKTHQFRVSTRRLRGFNSNLEKVILLIRNPYDAISSSYRYSKFGHTANEDKPLSENEGKSLLLLP